MHIIKPSVVIETPESHIQDYMKLLEKFGRVCHKTESAIAEGTADVFVNKYMIEMGHESVLEHCSLTARFICDRSASHQLVRHRIGSFSQESQRYVDYSETGLEVVCPPSIRNDPVKFKSWADTVETLEKEYRRLLSLGVPPEDARSVLPNCTKTEVVATFNLRQWRHVFMQRALNPRAQWEIRELMTDLMKECYRLLPVVFGDLQQKILYNLMFEKKDRWEE